MTKRQNILLQLKTYDLISLPSGRKERSPMQNEKLRNVAIIAHVDHGKTTLVDEMLKQGQQEATPTQKKNYRSSKKSNSKGVKV